MVDVKPENLMKMLTSGIANFISNLLSNKYQKDIRKKIFRTAPYVIMHAHLIGDTLNNKAPNMDA